LWYNDSHEGDDLMARTVKLSIYEPPKEGLNDLFHQKSIYKPVNGLPKLDAVIPPPYNARNPPPRPEAEVPLRITGMLPPWVSSPEITMRKPPRLIFPQGAYWLQKTMWRKAPFSR
jgi:hypothetical protein